MGSFYELDEDERALLLDALEMYRQEGKFWDDAEITLFEELRHYLKTRERPPVVFTRK